MGQRRRTIAACIAFASLAAAARATDSSIAVNTLPLTYTASTRLVAPTGVVVDGRGDVFVADAGQNRIFEIAGTSVRSVAGGGALDATTRLAVPGFVDGPAQAARFNRPSGLALTADGALVIADAGNHAVRLLKDGVVSTIAGGPSAATFFRPTSVAVDAAGNILVADLRALRKIDKNRTVSTINLGVHPIGVAVAGKAVVVADELGLAFTDPKLGTGRFNSIAVSNSPLKPAEQWLRAQGEDALGTPFALAAIDDTTVAFTDMKSDSVRTIDIASHRLRVIAGPDTENGNGDDGARVDGRGAQARFFNPAGIAYDGKSRLYVADLGDRSIRTVSPVTADRYSPEKGTLNQLFAPPLVVQNKTTYRVALFSNSAGWWHSGNDTSIASAIVERVNAVPSFRTHYVAQALTVYAPDATFADTVETISSTADEHLFDTAVLMVNNIHVIRNYKLSGYSDKLSQEQWASITISLKQLEARLASDGIKLLVVVQPFPEVLGINEGAWRLFEFGQSDDDFRVWSNRYDELLTSVRQSHAHVYSLRDDLMADMFSSKPSAVYGTEDNHFTAFGRHLVGNAIGKALLDQGLLPK